MATVSDFINALSATEDLGTRVVKAENLIDFSKTNASASDKVQVLRIPEGAHVVHVGWEVQTAEGATATADMGDDADPNGFDDGIDLNATGNGASTSGTDTFAAAGKFYTSADTIDLYPDHDLDAAKINVWAIYAKAENT